jgi:O-antigen ligase
MLSFESSLFYFRIGVFSCFIWYLIDKDKSILTLFYYALVLCFSALVIDGYIQYFTGVNLAGFKISGIVSHLFLEMNLLWAHIYQDYFPLLFALFLIKKKQKYEIYFIGAFIYSSRCAYFYVRGKSCFFLFKFINSIYNYLN